MRPSRGSAALLVAVQVTSVIVTGLLTGGNVDRALIARPAWNRVGLVAWADYTRHADLANGRYFYPALALSATVLCVAAAVLWRRWKAGPAQAGLAIDLGASCMLLCLPVSLEAAPFLLRLRGIDDTDVAGLRAAFEGSYVWGVGQTLLHSAAFVASVWGLAASRRGEGFGE
ncbi:hypothetical protein DYQ86_06470 [Acidobacteria bacterium AB60]|nr:hypothetical protein DYQ86_06470 [Acidobacteria bacterium AB60]